MKNLNGGIKPLVSPADQPPGNEFDGIDPSVIDFPDKVTPLEDAYHQTSSVAPKTAGEVFNLSKQTGQPPDFLADNLDAAKAAAAVPSTDYFKDIARRYPQTSSFLSDPRHMAMAHDDIENFTKIEKLVSEHSFMKDSFNSLMAGVANFNKTLASVPNALEGVAMLPWNFGARIAGRQDLEVKPNFPGADAAVKYWGDAARAYRPAINEESISDVLRTGNVGVISRAITSKIIEGAPSLALLIGAAATGGAGIGAAVAGVGAGADIYERNKQIGLDPSDASLNALYHGVVNAAFMDLGTYSPLQAWEHAIAPRVGVDTARKVVLDVMKTIMGTGANFAGIMGATTLAGAAIDRSTGAQTDPTASLWKQTLDSSIEGFFTGAAMGGATGTIGARYRAARLPLYDSGRSYSEIGKALAEAKMPERSKEAHQDFVSGLVNGSDLENVMVPAQAFEQYFQSKNIDPVEMADRLGVREMFMEARDRGGDVAVPFENWAGEFAKTPHFEGLKDDIRFDEGRPTVNETKIIEETVGKGMDEAVKNAAKENTAWDEGRKRVVDQFTAQLIASKAYNPRDAAIHAEAGAKIIERLAALNRMPDPYSYLEKHPIEIVNGEMVQVKPDLMQSATPEQQAFDKFYTPSGAPGETKETDFVRGDLKKFKEAYQVGAKKELNIDVANYVSGDLAKTIHVDGREKFTFNLSAPRHEGSSAFGKMYYDELLADPEKINNPVIVSAGSSGVGKTSGLKLAEGKKLKEAAAIYDTNIASESSGKRIINKGLETGPTRDVVVVYTHRDPIKAFEEGVYPRFIKHEEHRIVPIPAFLSTLGARETITKLVEAYKENPRVKFRFVDNSGKKGEAKVVGSLDKLPNASYTKSEVKERLNAFIETKLKSGEITQAQADAFRGHLGEQPGELNSGGLPQGGSPGRSGDAQNLTLYQADLNDPTLNPRASISFQPDKAVIALSKADPSTFMHEMSHYWLKNFNEFIAGGTADQRANEDWGTLKKWLGVKDDQKGITSQQQEKFARGFERYLYEGHAPSDSLRGAFRKFRTWLTRIYSEPEFLSADLTPEVREVMDRMLASEQEIAFAESQTPREDYTGLNLDPKIVARLDKLHDEAHDAAVDELFKKQMEEITAENKKNLVDESTKARIKAQDAIENSPIQQALGAIKKTIGDDPVKLAEKVWANKGELKDVARLDPIAENYGFSSPSELAYKILQEPPVAKQVQDMVDQHMAQFAELRNTDKIKEAAMAAVHNERSVEIMAREAAIFQGLIDQAQGRIVDQRVREEQARIEGIAAREKAKQIISSMSTSEAKKFLPYFTAERNAAVRVKKALLERNYAEAAKAKREQMLNHALVREAYAFKNEFNRTMRFFDRFASRGIDLKNVPYGFIRQIDTLLANHGLADPRAEDAQTYLATAKDMAARGEDGTEIAHRTGWMIDDAGNWKQESMRDTLVRIQEDYRNLSLPESVLFDSNKNYRQMKVGEFRDLKAAVRAINAVGRGYDNFLDETLKIDRKSAAAQVRQFIEQNIGRKYAERRDIGKKAGSNTATETLEKILDLPNAAVPGLVNLYRICDFLDAGKPDGLMKNLVYRPLLHAERGEITTEGAAIEAINKLHDKFWKEGEYEKFRKEVHYISSRDRDMTMDEIMAVALNQGTETNRQRIRDGYNLAPDQLKEILGKLGKREWDYAQAIWDHFEEYWPKIVAVQEKVAGETPTKVKAATVETPFGTYRGGYYPLSYDYNRSSDALNNIEGRNALYKTAGSVVAHTDHGFTEKRLTNYVSPVRLDTNVIYSHLQDVIHDLNYRQAVVDVNGFLRQKDTREAIINAIGLEGYRTVEKHLKWVAADQGEYLHAADRILRRLRFTGTTAMLGLRPLNFPMDVTGNLISAAQDVGPVNFGNAIKDFVADRAANTKFVEENSPRMAKRSTMRDRDLNDMAKRFHGEQSVFQHFLFYGASKADEAVSFPLWLMTYQKNVDEFGHVKAVDLADEAVTKAVGSGSILDQAMIQRGGEIKKIFTWWYSWSGMQFNRMWAAGKFAGLEYDHKNIGTALSILAGSAIYGWGLQAVNENFWRELFRNTQAGDEDKKSKRMAIRTIMQPISYIPLIRDVAQYGLGKITGTHADLQLPFQDSIKSLADPLADMIRAGLTDQSLSPRFWENTAKGLALGVGYPQYLNTLIFNFLDNLNGMGDASWRDLLTRKTKN